MGAQVAAVKRCTKCGVIKPVDAFHRNRARDDGRQSWCKFCGDRRKPVKAAPVKVAADSAPPDPALRELLFTWRPEAEGLREPGLRNLEEVLWGLICDDDHPQYRAAYACARGENG